VDGESRWLYASILRGSKGPSRTSESACLPPDSGSYYVIRATYYCLLSLRILSTLFISKVAVDRCTVENR